VQLGRAAGRRLRHAKLDLPFSSTARAALGRGDLARALVALDDHGRAFADGALSPRPRWCGSTPNLLVSLVLLSSPPALTLSASASTRAWRVASAA
jgi:hypothetical protein